jgi:hypothetical protein
MRYRCLNPKEPDYQRYGARGITICDRWLGKDGFKNFYADMGPRPAKNYSIDREDNDGNYEPSNCRWATKAQQSANRRGVLPPAVVAKIKECKDIPLAALAAEFGCSESAIRRVRNGQSFGLSPTKRAQP